MLGGGNLRIERGESRLINAPPSGTDAVVAASPVFLLGGFRQREGEARWSHPGRSRSCPDDAVTPLFL